MPIQFERPVGAQRDVKELEYVSALHQSGNKIRPDASITAQDVLHFLRSRHGVTADLAYIKENFMPGLAGAFGDNPDPVFDVVELTCMLLIPNFLRSAPEIRKSQGDDFYSRVLHTILQDALPTYTVENPPLLTRELLKSILEVYGEGENARPQDIDAMLFAARAHVGTVFTPEVLARGCISDLEHYRLEWEDSLTTHYDDVFSGTHLDTTANDNEEGVLADLLGGLQRIVEKADTPKEQTIEVKKAEHIERIFTFSSIDYIAENYRSVYFSVILWVAIVVGYFGFMSDVRSVLGHMECDRFGSEFGCRVANAIVAWLIIFVQLSFVGTGFVVLASAGNSIYARKDMWSFLLSLVGMVVLFLTCVLQYFRPTTTPVSNSHTSNDPIDKTINLSFVALGLVLMCFQFKSLLVLVVPESWYVKFSLIHRFLVPGITRKEKQTKKAARWKTERMVTNALEVHSRASLKPSSRSSTHVSVSGNALLAFESTLYEREKVGGISWTFARMWDGSLFNEEGVWLHARLIASNISQYFVAAVYLVTICALFYWFFIKNSDDTTVAPTISPAPTYSPAPTIDPVNAAAERLQPIVNYVLDQMGPVQDETLEVIWQKANSSAVTSFTGGILESVSNQTLKETLSSLDSATLSSLLAWGQQVLGSNSPARSRSLQDNSGSNSEGWVKLPETWMFAVSMAFAGVCALSVVFGLAIVWLPSSVSTILQFRSGVIGSLHSKSFQQYRVAPDLTTILFGSTFWGAVIASGYLFAIVFVIVLVALWEPTRPFLLKFIAQILAISVTILVKTIILMFLRNVLFKGLYRRNPASSNLMMVVLECWSLGLTAGTIFARLVKLLAVSAFYVGRLDTLLFADGVGQIGPVPIDSYPVQFRKDLLLHDAHRHPYLERLGAIYMLKLRYGEEFGRAPQSAWRLVVVSALMPWLRRFRLDEIELDEEGSPVATLSLDELDEEKCTTASMPDQLAMLDELETLRAKLSVLQRENEALRGRDLQFEPEF